MNVMRGWSRARERAEHRYRWRTADTPNFFLPFFYINFITVLRTQPKTYKFELFIIHTSEFDSRGQIHFLSTYKYTYTNIRGRCRRTSLYRSLPIFLLAAIILSSFLYLCADHMCLRLFFIKRF